MNIEEIINATTMIPGIGLCIYYINYIHNVLPLYGYIITCINSMIYHIYYAFFGFNQNYLKLDLIGQHICALTLSLALEQNNISISIPLILYIVFFDLNNDYKRGIAIALNGGFILIAFNEYRTLIYQFGIGMTFYGISKIHVKYSGFYHTLWHFMCHLIFYNIINTKIIE